MRSQGVVPGPPLLERLTLVAITPGRGLGSDIVERAVKLGEGGVSAFWIREPQLTGRELYEGMGRLRDAVVESVAWIVGDRVDVALAVQADAVHLGFRSLPMQQARDVVGERLAIGFSLHEPVGAHADSIGVADYLTLSPVFSPKSKSSPIHPLGPEILSQRIHSLAKPVVALGGIDAENARRLQKSGAIGIAAVGSLFCADDPRGAAAHLRASFLGDVE